MINAANNSSNDSNNRISWPEPASDPSNSSMHNLPNMATVSRTTDACDWRAAAGTTVSTPVLTTTTTTTSSTDTTTMSSTAEPALMHELPSDLKFHIFQQLPHTALFDRSLFALACTSMRWRADVKAFLTPERACIGFGDKPFHKEGLALWQAESKKLYEQTPILKEDFRQSRGLIEQACTPWSSAEVIWPSISQLAGIEINFREIRDISSVIKIVEKCHDQTIKFSTAGVRRHRFLQDVLPVLSKIPAGCRVVLDASYNDLQPQDLLPLVKFMKANPCIVQLDLSGNVLCHKYRICMPIVELFQTPSPLSHLYLANTHFNDETAAEISKALSNNPCLRHLDLQRNMLNEDGAVELIGAVGSSNWKGEVHTNTVLTALRLQGNDYGYHNVTIFWATEQAHKLIVKAKPDCDTHPYIIQVDTTSGAIDEFLPGYDTYTHQFDKEAEAEKL